MRVVCAAFLILFLFTNGLWTYKYDRIMAIIFVRKINGAIAYDYCVKAKFIIFHEIEIIARLLPLLLQHHRLI